MTGPEHKKLLETDGISRPSNWLWAMLSAAVMAGVLAAFLSFVSVDQGKTAQRDDVLRNRVELLQEQEHTLEHSIRTEESRACLLDYMRGITEFAAARRPLSEVPVPPECAAQDLAALEQELAEVQQELIRAREHTNRR